MKRLSLAVAARRSEPADSLDYFPTPPWATRALLEFIPPSVTERSAWDPACGEGHMAEVLKEEFHRVCASDVHDYGYGRVADFLDDRTDWPAADWIITNPPFNRAAAFARQALEGPTTKAFAGVALLVRLQWLESAQRYWLFQRRPPSRVLIFSGRCAMVRGRFDPAASTATAYCWVIWRMTPARRSAPTHLHWIHPDAQKLLTRPDDAMRFGAVPPAPLLEGGA